MRRVTVRLQAVILTVHRVTMIKSEVGVRVVVNRGLVRMTDRDGGIDDGDRVAAAVAEIGRPRNEDVASKRHKH